MKRLYHVTERETLPKILSEGLSPGASRGLTEARRKIPRGVYFFENLGFAENFLALEGLEDEDLIVLEVDLPPGFKLYSDRQIPGHFSFYTKRGIPAKYITRVLELSEEPPEILDIVRQFKADAEKLKGG